jgi:hypothetical protein
MKYTPKVYKVGNEIYIEMLLNGEECSICKKIMVKEVKESLLDRVFPFGGDLCQQRQITNAGIVFKSRCKVDNKYICVECERGGKATFKCELCGERKLMNKIKERVGDPEDYLCTDCYENKSAKIFDDKLDELIELHRYDFD